MVDLYGFGIAAVDDFVELASFPHAGAKMPVLARSRHGGGLCATALVAAARLGLRCSYGGLLGNNDLSEFTRSVLRAEGIAIDGPESYPDAEPFHSTILLDRQTGERTILFSSKTVVEPGPSDIREDILRQSKALFVDHLGPDGTLHACKLAKIAGVPIVADIERVEDDRVRQIVRLIDHLILPLRLAREITGCDRPEECVTALAVSVRPCTAVTDGVNGCWYVEGDEPSRVRRQAAFAVETVDTTGCGDTFHGAYAACVVWGMTVAQSIRFASAAAAIKATRRGGQAGIPDQRAVERFLTERTGASLS